MKKFIALVACFVLMFSISLPCYAASIEETISITTENLGNGITVETEIVELNSNARATYQKTGSVKKTYKNGSSVIATVTLTATFTYDNTSASVKSTSSSHTVASGWTYKNEDIWDSGNTAYLSAQLYNFPIGTVDVDMSLSCSPTGVLS